MIKPLLDRVLIKMKESEEITKMENELIKEFSVIFENEDYLILDGIKY